MSLTQFAPVIRMLPAFSPFRVTFNVIYPAAPAQHRVQGHARQHPNNPNTVPVPLLRDEVALHPDELGGLGAETGDDEAGHRRERESRREVVGDRDEAARVGHRCLGIADRGGARLDEEPQVGSGRCRGRPAHIGDDEDLARRDRERKRVFTAVEVLAPEVRAQGAREFVAAEADEVCHRLADVREHRGGAARPRGLAGARRQREKRDGEGRCEERSLADLAHANPLSSGEFQSRARTDSLSSAPLNDSSGGLFMSIL
jgi:hypothetical protein